MPTTNKPEEKKPTVSELKAQLKKETDRANQAEAKYKSLMTQSETISKAYLDIKGTATDMATILEAQARLFTKLPGIAQIKNK